MFRRVPHTCLLALAALFAGLTSTAHAYTPTASNGGTAYLAPGGHANLVKGVAIPPTDAPPQVVGIINAANAISTKPYRLGGGHNTTFVDSAYDCSGSVSFALHGGGLLTSPLSSSPLMSWGDAGIGRWVTIYSNPGHAFMIVAGLRFDTGYRDRRARVAGIKPGTGPRWGKPRPTAGYIARHPTGF
jgi:cell wall-associated NlpC family hydrolase